MKSATGCSVPSGRYSVPDPHAMCCLVFLHAPAEIKEFVLDNLNKDFIAAAKENWSDYLTVYYFMTCESSTLPVLVHGAQGGAGCHDVAGS